MHNLDLPTGTAKCLIGHQLECLHKRVASPSRDYV